MLVTSIFFFSHDVFKRPFPPVRQKSSLCGKVLFAYQFWDNDYSWMWDCMQQSGANALHIAAIKSFRQEWISPLATGTLLN